MAQQEETEEMILRDRENVYYVIGPSLPPSNTRPEYWTPPVAQQDSILLEVTRRPSDYGLG